MTLPVQWDKGNTPSHSVQALPHRILHFLPKLIFTTFPLSHLRVYIVRQEIPNTRALSLLMSDLVFSTTCPPFCPFEVPPKLPHTEWVAHSSPASVVFYREQRCFIVAKLPYHYIVIYPLSLWDRSFHKNRALLLIFEFLNSEKIDDRIPLNWINLGYFLFEMWHLINFSKTLLYQSFL